MLFMHHQVHKGGEDEGEQRRKHIAGKLDVAPKHHQVHLHGGDDVAMQQHPQRQPRRRPHQGEHHVFPRDVGGHLVVVKAKHLDGGKLSFPLGDVDVGQVVQDHKGQRAADRMMINTTESRLAIMSSK